MTGGQPWAPPDPISHSILVNTEIGVYWYADCDGNGTLDIFDFLCFQNAFVGGCP